MTQKQFRFTLKELSQDIAGIDRGSDEPGELLAAVHRAVRDRAANRVDDNQIKRCRAWRRHLVLAVGTTASGKTPKDYTYEITKRNGRAGFDSPALKKRYPAFYESCRVPSPHLSLAVPGLHLPALPELVLPGEPDPDATAAPYGKRPSAKRVESAYDAAKKRIAKRQERMDIDREIIVGALERCLCPTWNGTAAKLADGATVGLYQIRFCAAVACERNPAVMERYAVVGEPIIYVLRKANDGSDAGEGDDEPLAGE